MSQSRMPKGSLLLAGLAAFAYYKYSKLSPEKKQDLTKNLREKGKQFYDKYVPEDVKNLFGKRPDSAAAGSGFTERN